MTVDKIQLIFFFISGFAVSRLMIKARLPHRLVYWLIGKRQLSLTRILFYLIAISAFLSFFIPNAITVLTLLPLLDLLRRSYETNGGASKNIATMLALATIYGANIGGMGSITATPANGILVTYAVLNDVPGTQYLTFASWLVWGIPLVIVFTAIAGLILCAVLRPWRHQNPGIQLAFDAAETCHPLQKITLWMTACYFLSSFCLSLLMMYAGDRTGTVLIVSGSFTLGFILILFFLPVRTDKKTQSGKTLLSIADCGNDLPTRGFVFVGLAVLLAAVLYAFGIHKYVAGWADRILPSGIPVYALFCLMALATSFATEALSNTAVQLGFFVMALALARAWGFYALDLLVIITLSCTSAFMSPIATGVNGLAFGGVKGVSILKMLVVGFFLNIAGAFLISGWVYMIVDPLYR